MPSPTQRRGGRAELRAVFYLRRHGYTIIAQHITSRFGEIDIICKKDETIYVVEVKYRRKNDDWPIELAMTEGKVRRMVLTYQAYAQETKQLFTPNLACLWLLLSPDTIRVISIG